MHFIIWALEAGTYGNDNGVLTVVNPYGGREKYRELSIIRKQNQHRLLTEYGYKILTDVNTKDDTQVSLLRSSEAVTTLAETGNPVERTTSVEKPN